MQDDEVTFHQFSYRVNVLSKTTTADNSLDAEISGIIGTIKIVYVQMFSVLVSRHCRS